jgi:hypothetical protein
VYVGLGGRYVFEIQKVATIREGVVDLRVVPELKMAAVAGER